MPSNCHPPDSRHHLFDTENIDEPPQVVGEDMQAHFRTCILESLHQEVGRPHPELQRTEDMFNGAPALFHLSRLRIQTTLHSIQNIFVFPALDATLLASSVLASLSARWAV